MLEVWIRDKFDEVLESTAAYTDFKWVSMNNIKAECLSPSANQIYKYLNENTIGNIYGE